MYVFVSGDLGMAKPLKWCRCEISGGNFTTLVYVFPGGLQKK